MFSFNFPEGSRLEDLSAGIRGGWLMLSFWSRKASELRMATGCYGIAATFGLRDSESWTKNSEYSPEDSQPFIFVWSWLEFYGYSLVLKSRKDFSSFGLGFLPYVFEIVVFYGLRDFGKPAFCSPKPWKPPPNGWVTSSVTKSLKRCMDLLPLTSFGITAGREHRRLALKAGWAEELAAVSQTVAYTILPANKRFPCILHII